MSIESTLGDLSARFVSEKQFDALDAYIKKYPNKELQAISKKNRKLLEWDKNRLPELKKFLKGSSAAKNFSVLLSIILLMTTYFVQ